LNVEEEAVFYLLKLLIVDLEFIG